jgi:peptide/nickel transport system substrate-binding protein
MIHATALSNLLADSADASYLTLEYPESRILEREWSASGKGIVQFSPSGVTMMLPQFKAEITSPPDLLNLQVRRALMHAMNRQDLTDGLDLGPEMIAHSTGYPGTAIGDAVAPVVVRYDHDPARAAALLAEAGWQPGADGLLTKAGRRLEVEFRGLPNSATAVVFPILEQQYRRAGITLNLRHYLATNLEEQVTYPGLLSTGLTTNTLIFAQRWHSRFIAGPQTRYSGENRMGYSEPATDAAIDRLVTAVRRPDQLRYWGEAWRRITEDVGILPMYYQVDSYVVRKGFVGLQPRNPLGAPAYQVHLWEAP